VQHVILISLDGFHDFDLARYVARHPGSAMARLSKNGITYTNARTTGPSDSYPGLLALTTGGTPISTGILYDNSWDDTLSQPGSKCSTVGTQVLYVGLILAKLDAQNLTRSTVFILAAKHGNSPVDRALKRTTDDGPYSELVNSVAPNLLANLTDDDEAIIWLTDHSKAEQVAAVLRANIDQVGGGTVFVGAELDDLLGGRMIANRRPYVIVNSTLGVIYSSHPQKLVEHGGFHETDWHVSLLVSNPALPVGQIRAPVSNTQVAPSILKLLGLDPRALQALQQEQTPVLPGLALPNGN
jgi:arylsulfatase A-like enzyme